MPDETLTPELNIKIRDLEERQRLIKDKLDLLSSNFADFRELTEKEISELKFSINTIQSEIKKIKEALLRISEELENKAKRSELELIAKQLKILKPLM